MSNSAGEDGVNKVTELAYRDKVPVVVMKEILHDCLIDRLTGQAYEGDKCNEAAKHLADHIRDQLKKLGYDRYKYIVQVLIGERRDQGVYFGTRCFWDANTDNQASETFTNVSRIDCHIFFSCLMVCLTHRTSYFAQRRHMRSICISYCSRNGVIHYLFV